MKVIHLRRAPASSDKKWEVTLPDGKKVRFGARGYSDFTLHGDAKRMMRYVVRHGGTNTVATRDSEIINKMSIKKRSSKENWSVAGLNTPGFWSRWLLWSFPTIDAAVRHIETKVLPKGKYKIIKKR